MNMTSDLIGLSVKYVGGTRDELRGLVGTVEKVSDTDSVGVRYPDGVAEAFKGSDGLVWASRWAWNKVVDPARPISVSRYGVTTDLLDIEKTFTEAAGGPRAVIVSEIARLKGRLSDLEKALEVIDSL